jgi:hypothetical protein
MSALHTAGPWDWYMHSGERPYLATPDRGRLYVMDFGRKGMQGAAPRFSHWNGIDDGKPRERMGGIMNDGILLKDGSLHPDARLMAAAPVLLTASIEAEAVLCAMSPPTKSMDIPDILAALAKLRAAMTAATGRTL